MTLTPNPTAADVREVVRRISLATAYSRDRTRCKLIRMTQMMEIDALLTVNEVAARLRVAPVTVYRWLRRGELEGVRFVGTVRVPAAEVERLLTTTRRDAT